MADYGKRANTPMQNESSKTVNLGQPIQGENFITNMAMKVMQFNTSTPVKDADMKSRSDLEETPIENKMKGMNINPNAKGYKFLDANTSQENKKQK